MNLSKCPLSSRVPQGFGYSLKIGKDSSNIISNCAFPCQNELLSQNNQRILILIIIIISIISLFLIIYGLSSHILTISSKLTQYYPERATIFLLFCHGIISICFLTSSIFENFFGCQEINGILFRVQNNNNLPCTIIHSILLYFFIASQIWWIIYCFCIYMISSAQWISETISLKSHIFHMIAWIIPAIITFISLLFESISSDLFTGVCFIDVQKVSQLVLYFIGPLTISMIFGIILIMISLSNLIKFRRQFTTSIHSNQITQNAKLQDLQENEVESASVIFSNIDQNNHKNDPHSESAGQMLTNQLRSMDNYIWRTSLFASLYFVFNIFLLVCFLFETHRRPDWNALWHLQHCSTKDGQDCGVLANSSDKSLNQTTKEIFLISLIKYLSWQIAGWASLIYVMNRHSHQRWLLFCSNPVAFFASKNQQYV